MMDEVVRRHRIALFIPDLSMGGAERVFVTLSRLLLQRGHDITLILANKRGPLLDELDPRVTVFDLAAFRTGEPLWKSGLCTVFALRRYLRESPPDVLMSTLTGANLAAVLAWWLAHKPCRLIIREAASLANVKSRGRTLLMRWLYPLASRIVVLTDYMKQQLGQLGLSEDRFIVIGNPVDAEHLQTLAERPVPDMVDTPYILSVGRLAKPKDFSTLIRAFVSLKDHQDLKLIILGEGPLRPELEALIDELGQGHRIKLMGLVLNPYPWLKQASVFVLSSNWEGYPNVLLEAQCFRLPVVVTEYDPSVFVVLADHHPKRSVPVADVQCMAQAIDELLKLYGHARGAPRCNPQVIVDRYEALLTDRNPHA